MDIEYTSEDQRDEQIEVFVELKADIESNDELSDNEKERQIKQLELEYAQLQERWQAEDLQQEEREQNYLSRDTSFFPE